jgi:ABC-type antimicrobial peptide transport system permease subunit
MLSRQILFISLIQAFIGVSLGILTGYLIILVMNRYNLKLFSQLDFQFKYASITLLLALSITGGVIAGIFPILKLYRTRAGDMINKFM